jgi:hypothetical protein
MNRMRPQILILTIACLATTPAWAGAGLTSAGVDPTPTNNQPAEPTLAQVAPQGTQGTTGTPAGTVTPGVAPTVQAGTTSTTGAAGTNATPIGGAAPAVIVAPPPPPDPATLPVSVIRPVNKAAPDPAAAAATARAGDDTSASPQQALAHKMPLAPRPGATTPAAPPSLPSSSPASLHTSAATATSRPDATVRPASETAPEEPADASSSGFIFYAGVGIAAIILLLSLGAFFRGGGSEPGKQR